MRLELYYGEMSSCSSMTRLVLAEKGLHAEHHLVDLGMRANLTPAYLKLNPKGEVPVMVFHPEGAEPEVVPDSLAITKRLEAPDVGGKSLEPKDGGEAAMAWVDRARKLPTFTITFCDISSDKGESKGGKYLEATYAALQQLAREHPDMAGVAQAKMELMQTTRKAVCTQQELHDAWAAFETFFKAMDQELARSQAPFIAGQEYSFADAHITPLVARVAALGRAELIAAHPALQAWWERIQARPSYKTVFPTGPR